MSQQYLQGHITIIFEGFSLFAVFNLRVPQGQFQCYSFLVLPRLVTEAKYFTMEN